MNDSIVGKLILGILVLGMFIGCLVFTGVLNAVPLP